MIVFVSGGARSGKSAVAERLTRAAAAPGGRCGYLATGRASDAEMAARITRHRRQRGPAWQTREVPLSLDTALAGLAPGSAALLDCLTLWVARALYEEGAAPETLPARLAALLVEARRRRIHLVVVSNDLNEGLPPRDAETWRYLATLQCLHRRLAREADRVIEVVAGLAIDWTAEREPAGPAAERGAGRDTHGGGRP